MLRKWLFVLSLVFFPSFEEQEVKKENYRDDKMLSLHRQTFQILARIVSLCINRVYRKMLLYIFLTAVLFAFQGMLLNMLADYANGKEIIDMAATDIIRIHALEGKSNITVEFNGTGIYDTRLEEFDSKLLKTSILFHAKAYFKNIDNLDRETSDLKGGRRPWYLKHRNPVNHLDVATVCPLDQYFNEVLQNNPTTSLMRHEWARVASFKKFPVESPMSALRLAQNGFYYTGTSDRVTCFSCNVEYENWKIGDIPSLIHKQLKSDCRFLTGEDASNVPIHENTGPISEPTNKTKHDTPTTSIEAVVSDGPLSAGSNLQSHNEQEATRVQEELIGATAAPVETSKDIGNDTVNDRTDSIQVKEQCDFMTKEKDSMVKRPPRHPDYEDVNKRKDTFKDWPIEHIIPAQVLMLAGFVYAGTSDCVRCYHCAIGLRNWEEGDDPWVEHARWSQNCDYLRQIKGVSFIQKYATQIDGVRDEPRTNKPSTRSTNTTNQKKQNAPTPPYFKNQKNENKSSQSNNAIKQLDATPSRKDSVMVREENNRLRSQITCKICMDRETNTVCLPCGHLVTCNLCTANLRKCAICRTKIQARVKVFMS